VSIAAAPRLSISGWNLSIMTAGTVPMAPDDQTNVMAGPDDLLVEPDDLVAMGAVVRYTPSGGALPLPSS
jgi:hypothetical protein